MALLGCGACWRAPSRPPNVVVILIDTLRADRVGWNGGDAKLTPFLDQFASRATVFSHAYASSSWTLPSVASLFTSRFQSQHRVVIFKSTLAAEETTLAEILAANGYLTAAFSANISVAPRSKFDQGFRYFEVRPEKGGPLVKGSAEEINQTLLSWYDRLGEAERRQPVFLYVQYMEPHTPYSAPDAILTQVLSRRGSVADGRHAVERAQAAFWGRKEGEPTDWVATLDAEQRQGIIDLYDAEVAHVDIAIRQLFGGLEAKGVLDDNTIVVITADHGEELFDHGGYAHGHNLYEEVTRVPLAIRLPGQTAGKVWPQPVSLVDLAPTLLDFLSIEPPAAFEGRSLLPLLRSQSSASAAGAVFSELFSLDRDKRSQPPQQVVVDHTHKLITSPPSRIEAFDLQADPGERDPSALDEKERARLGDELRRFNERISHGVSSKPDAELDQNTRERLRALGYSD